jgi:hypothetical protein
MPPPQPPAPPGRDEAAPEDARDPLYIKALNALSGGLSNDNVPTASPPSPIRVDEYTILLRDDRGIEFFFTSSWGASTHVIYPNGDVFTDDQPAGDRSTATGKQLLWMAFRRHEEMIQRGQTPVSDVVSAETHMLNPFYRNVLLAFSRFGAGSSRMTRGGLILVARQGAIFIGDANLLIMLKEDGTMELLNTTHFLFEKISNPGLFSFFQKRIELAIA